jgi:RNA polymerase sigma-70 factor, ECF subfamily
MVRHHHPRLHGFAQRVLCGPDRADDVLQEAYLKAYRAADRIPTDADAQEAWLLKVVYRCCIDELRRRAKREPPAAADATPDPPNETSLADAVSAKEAVYRALEQLPLESRAAIILVDGFGFDYASAAVILKTNRGTIASRLHAGRTLMRHNLTQDSR